MRKELWCEVRNLVYEQSKLPTISSTMAIKQAMDVVKNGRMGTLGSKVRLSRWSTISCHLAFHRVAAGRLDRVFRKANLTLGVAA